MITKCYSPALCGAFLCDAILVSTSLDLGRLPSTLAALFPHEAMTDSADHRMTLRFLPDDLAWISAQADDEGVDNATMVRMIINRLRRGRAPLISMMEQSRPTPAYVAAVERATAANPLFDESSYEQAADDLLASRLAEVESGGDQVIDFQEAEPAAVPLRRSTGSTLYNPKPK